MPQLPPSYVVSDFRPTQRDPQEFGGFFLDLQDDLGLFQPLLEPGVLLTQLLVLPNHGITPASFGATLFSKRPQGALTPGSPPSGQMGGIQPFPSQQSGDFARLSTRVGLIEHLQLILGSERRRLALSRTSGSGGADSLEVPTLRSGTSNDNRFRPLRLTRILVSPLRPEDYTNLGGGDVSRNIGT